MAATEREEDATYAQRLSTLYAEQVMGLRAQLQAVDRNVMLYIAEGRERGAQIEAAIKQLGVCSVELGHIKAWGRVQFVVSAALALGVIALLIKVF